MKGRVAVYRDAFVNYRWALFHVFVKKYPFSAILRENNKHINISSPLEAYFYSRGLRDVVIDEGRDTVIFRFGNRQLRLVGAVKNGDLGASFGEYRYLSVKDRTVVDIGASIGDTAIYFALIGEATKIIALEPIQESYELAKKNTEINGCEDKIELINSGCGGVTKKIFIDGDTKAISSTILRETVSGTSVQLLTLKDITDKFCINDAVLKIDCEGCEYETVLMSDRETLRRFDQIQIEFHDGAGRLVKKLRSCGFQVYYSHGRAMGYIYAVRLD